ncbi:acetyltransferase, GNAT family [Erwinia amylovora Ea644]|uniref:GNAT family N-acetyltransferase n=1 Tax=Erwinia amylovora TaxID=552 RepID=UPI0002CB4716|nr:GNAT family N-acetyltransferase [Erwinia amylovora]MBZ2398463.1 GNAT family N-acetyltransferase [Erwinia amylovora]MBZ2402380.1 GNAT family N-acetyltransferase [Erwinia amylovora]CCP03876.1 acetyltransferase, GNAT family [Erwinia amylovora Ea644]
MSIIFHKLTERNLKDIYEIRFSVHENQLHDHQIGYMQREQVLEDINQGGGWICQAGDEYAGYALGIFVPEPLIGGLFVKPEYHNKGIGTQLLLRVTQWFFDQETTEISLTTDPGSKAEYFYQQRGWQPSGIDEFGQLILKKYRGK